MDFSIYVGDGFLVQTSEPLIPSFDTTDIFWLQFLPEFLLQML